jgi:hypothetical protein
MVGEQRSPGTESAKPVDDHRRQILLAEFTALRQEISALLTLQGQILNFGVVVFGLIAGLMAREESRRYVSLFPIPFVVLGLLYVDVGARIMRAARYIHRNIRPGLIALANEQILEWEAYIRQKHPGKLLMGTLDHLRWLSFLLPAGVFTVQAARAAQNGLRSPLVLIDVLFTVIYFVTALWVALVMSKSVTQA